MRLLPGRPDHAGRRAARRQSKPERPGNPRRHAGQYLPLRLLPAHRARRPLRRHGSREPCCTTSELRRAAAASMPVRAIIENVSRRSVLKGMTGFVVAMQVLPLDRGARVSGLSAWRAGACRAASSTIRISSCRLRPGRHGHHRRASLRDGHGLAHLDPDDHRRRDGSRLESREDRPGGRRRAAIRQPGHRRLAQPAPPHPAGARDGRRRCAACWRRPRRRVGASAWTRSRRAATR